MAGQSSLFGSEGCLVEMDGSRRDERGRGELEAVAVVAGSR